MAPSPTSSQWVLLSVLAISLAHHALAEGDLVTTKQAKPKDGRALSLFTIVTFPNDQCVTASDSTMRGTCLSSTQCSDTGGNADGNCASGFGVCCSYTISAQTGTVEQNCTYITNPSFPSSYAITASTTATYRVTPVNTEICQLRLDFDNFVISQPGTNGPCDTDSFVATGPTGRNPPTICGTNTGQHMYIETGQSSTQTTLVFTLDGTTATTRTYKIKVSQIPCNVNYKAPTDCTKYFTGQSGVTTTYNFSSTVAQMMQDQRYTTCIRRELGACSIQWAPTSITAPDPFALNALNAIATVAIEPTSCAISYVFIPTNLVTPPIFCGGVLSTITIAIAAQSTMVSGSVPSDVHPFRISLFSTAGNQVAAITGYSLMWTQIAC